ncbi:MAG: hypothetical protein RSD46_06375, partial [Oscillospiraceae bacterium]
MPTMRRFFNLIAVLILANSPIYLGFFLFNAPIMLKTLCFAVPLLFYFAFHMSPLLGTKESGRLRTMLDGYELLAISVIAMVIEFVFYCLLLLCFTLPYRLETLLLPNL